MKLNDYSIIWENTEKFHLKTHNEFVEHMNGIEWMKEQRDFVRENIFGFGEDSFPWLWKLIVDEMPTEFSFIEIGVFRGAILCLIRMLASATGRKVERYGVTPLDNSGGLWESDYKADIERLHDRFFVPKDYTLYIGSSTDSNIIEQSYNSSPYNMVYIDGSHKYEDVTSDLKHYAPMVKRGGYLVIDDACNDMQQPFGFFQGIKEVSDATLEYMTGNENWEFVFNVVHLRLYRRK